MSLLLLVTETTTRKLQVISFEIRKLLILLFINISLMMVPHLLHLQPICAQTEVRTASSVITKTRAPIIPKPITN